MELAGRRALVTGGASGIGLATVRRLAAEGATVAVADLDVDRGTRAAEEVAGLFLRMDVGDPVQVAEGFHAAAARLGGLDIAYLNAGANTGEADIAALTDARYRRALAVNVDQMVFGTREAVKIMTAGRGGAILATSGLAGLFAYAQDPIYCMAKHAVIGLVRGLAPTLTQHKITINAICPGVVATPLVSEAATKYLNEVGLPLLQPADIATAVVRAISSGGTGEAWICQPGSEPLPLGERITLAEVEEHVRRMEAALYSPDFPRN
ncbi:SDR family NAD(P)-dependent oxidoreductase [Acrocarpospora catenulata]|uniref:SDR family NAD(P)-dependent oxidoreductase n=1 Tax=Acrocarpospora catenulata TaxID=2836182 RepID=UPI001BD9536F|nr:SDR family NAD(P)-dependent oxidoreductase [Acrocarpospora catenulata]